MRYKTPRKRKNPHILRIRKNFYDILRMHCIRNGFPPDSHSIASLLGMHIEEYTAQAVESLTGGMKIEDYKRTWAIKPIKPLTDCTTFPEFLHHSNHSPQWIHKSSIYQDTNQVLTELTNNLVRRLTQTSIVTISPRNSIKAVEFTRFAASLLGITVNRDFKASLITAMHMNGFPLTNNGNYKSFKGCTLNL